METAQACRDLGLPNFYIAGGAITQLIWNRLSGRPLLEQVKDFDIVYFDREQHRSEAWYEDEISTRMSHTVEIDVKNQAIVHLWYPQKFGCDIPAYERVEQGIDSWLSAFAIGFTLNTGGSVTIYAPYGLEDAFQMNVKPNKIAMTEANYRKMTQSFKNRWPSISVAPWDEAPFQGGS
ncbi:nucleotidyltransferase family protein [Photobacterium sp. MCCC 1A19761]